MTYDAKKLSELTAHGMLCDFAEVSGGKLFISGAGIGMIGVAQLEPPFRVFVSLAVIVQIPWGATNQQHRLEIELISEEGSELKKIPLSEQLPDGIDDSYRGSVVALFNAGRSPMMVNGEQTLMPVAIPFQGLELPQLGTYFFSIKIDGSEVDRVSFRMLSTSMVPNR